MVRILYHNLQCTDILKFTLRFYIQFSGIKISAESDSNKRKIDFIVERDDGALT